MRKIKLFLSLLILATFGISNAWAETAALSISSGVTANKTLTDDGGNSWSVTSDGSYTSNAKYIQVGTNSKKVTYLKLSTSSFSTKSISKIQVWGTSKANTNVTIKIYVGGNKLGESSKFTTQNASNGGTEYSVENTNDYTGEILIEISRPTSATGAIYFNKAIVTYSEPGAPEKVLSSIEISGDLTNKTYEEGEELDLAGLTVTAKYDDNSEEDVTEDVEWSYTPNPLTKGTTSATVIATYEDKTATTTITGLTVNEHIITPGEYGITLNNVFFSTTAGTNISSFPTSAKQDDITVTLNGSGTKTRTDAANVRMYSGNTLTFSVPVGYLITSLAFTKPSSSTQWDGKITVNPGDYDETNKSWSGLAQDVVFTFGAQNRIAKAIVTYVADVKSTLTIETPQNGTISVKNGTTEVTSGTQLSAGTSLVVTPTPATGYVFESLTVNGSAVELTDGSYTLTMPAADVTIAATFELAKTLTEIKITTPATQTTFWQGETFNSTGLKVTAHFDGAANEDVTDKVTVTGSTATAGTQTVTISYKEGATTETATYNITVKATANTQETAYNVATAREIIDAVSTAKDIYVTGVVSEIVTAYNSQYGNISYNISADGLTTSDQLLSYRGKSYNGENFTSDDDIQVGDEVVVKGNLKLYEDTYEFDAGNQLVSLNRTKQQAGLSYTTSEYNLNLGDAFTAPTLNNPHTLAVTYSSNNEDVATVAADGAVTIKAAGTVTITASFAGNASYAPGEASYTIKVVGIASLPFAFDGKCADIANTAGMSQEGIDLDDYASSPHLKINTTGDYLTIHFDSEPDKLTYDIKGNSFSGGTFTVQESADGETYTTIATYTELGEKVSEEKELESTSRYVKFIYTKKVNGNVALGNISITKPDTRKDAGLAWSEETVTLTVGDAFTAPTFSNPNEVEVTYTSDNESLATISDAGVIALVENATGTATITASFLGDDTYKPATATCTIKVKPVQEDCEGSDDFETATTANNDATSYKSRTTDAGWKATNAAKTTLEGYTYLTINGKTSAVGTITSPVLNGGLGSIKIRYANTYSENNGVSFRLDIKQNGEVVKTYTITYKTGVTQNTVYTELIEDINVDGDFQMVFTNLSPSKSTSNKDRVSIGRLCWTGYVVPTPEVIREELTAGNYYTICMTKAMKEIQGATLWSFCGKDANFAYLVQEDAPYTAGKAYIMYAEAETVSAILTGDEVPAPVVNGAIHGTFVDMNQDDLNAAGDNIYLVIGNQLRRVDGQTGNSLPANRAYVDIDEITGGAPAGIPANRVRSMPMQPQVATGMENVDASAQPVKTIINGQLFILRGEKMYDAQGKLVK